MLNNEIKKLGFLIFIVVYFEIYLKGAIFLEKYSFYDLVDIIKKLRDDNGCPWDKVQTHESLKKAMLEEAYEAFEAIDNKDMKNLCEELGDVILQAVFHAQIESEKGVFNIDDVTDGICKKMIYRHPHIFSNAKAETSEEVLSNWEELKKKEKHYETQTDVLKGVAKALPALTRASKVQSKAADVGFDFQYCDDTIKKTHEEIDELYNAVLLGKSDNIEEEFGDILFSIVNISRFLKINPEFALTKAIEKFINRFEYVEKAVISEGKSFSDMSLDELDNFWNEAKKIEKRD